MNIHAVRSIYVFEMSRAWRTLMQSIISPVISTSLYFVVFGAAIGARIPQVGGIDGLLKVLGEAGVGFKDLQTSQSSLEDIFVSLVGDGQ